MKKYTAILAMLLLAAVSGAQPKKSYTSNLDSYAGTWVYSSGSEVFTLVLKKGTENTNSFYGDCLIGGYRHVKNGVLQGDYTQNLPGTITDSYYDGVSCPSFFGTNGTSNPNRIRPYISFYFWDRKYGDEMLKGTFRLLSSITAAFEVWEEEDLSGTTTGWQISVPKKVVMTKQ